MFLSLPSNLAVQQAGCWRRETYDKHHPAIDPRSDVFRYPVDKQGDPIQLGMEYINLEHLKNIMLGTSNVLDGSSIGISEYLIII